MEDEDTDEHIDPMNYQTNKLNLEVGEKYLSKFNLIPNNKKIITKNTKYQNKTKPERIKLNPSPNQYLTNDPIYIEDFLLSIRLRFNDVFQKVKEAGKILENIPEENNKSIDIIKGAVYLRKLNFNENFGKKKRKKKIDVNKVIEIQKIFKGYMIRNIDSLSDRLRLRQCLIELFCLLIYGHWYQAKLRYYIFSLEKYYKISKSAEVTEIKFEDKIAFRLPNCFYSGIKINNLKSDKLGKDRIFKE